MSHYNLFHIGDGDSAAMHQEIESLLLRNHSQETYGLVKLGFYKDYLDTQNIRGLFQHLLFNSRPDPNTKIGVISDQLLEERQIRKKRGFYYIEPCEKIKCLFDGKITHLVVCDAYGEFKYILKKQLGQLADYYTVGGRWSGLLSAKPSTQFIPDQNAEELKQLQSLCEGLSQVKSDSSSPQNIVFDKTSKEVIKIVKKEIQSKQKLLTTLNKNALKIKDIDFWGAMAYTKNNDKYHDAMFELKRVIDHRFWFSFEELEVLVQQLSAKTRVTDNTAIDKLVISHFDAQPVIKDIKSYLENSPFGKTYLMTVMELRELFFLNDEKKFSTIVRALNWLPFGMIVDGQLYMRGNMKCFGCYDNDYTVVDWFDLVTEKIYENTEKVLTVLDCHT